MRTRAIIIKKQATNEFDQLITIYTEDSGTLRAVAKSSLRASSKQAMHLEPLNLIEFEMIRGKALPIVASAQMVKQFSGIKNSIHKLASAQFFTEVLDKISFENEHDPRLWKFMNELLEEFNNCPESALAANFRLYQNKFLDVLGYAPRLDRCVICSNDAIAGPEPKVAISPELGGVLCGDCFLASGRGLLLDKNDLHQPVFVDTFFEYTIGKPLASLAFLYSIQKQV